eukprot:TRINITY_DN3191_c0_g1_i1.p1 TRINITY_DN3191_c0_g1~~TRINITY_DN3191_c0_g1_i1.p1  ORF type:complete len:83 (-),score=1.26 TRINITY_DN3191_c0_g1_i1:56-304(-)
MLPHDGAREFNDGARLPTRPFLPNVEGTINTFAASSSRRRPTALNPPIFSLLKLVQVGCRSTVTISRKQRKQTGDRQISSPI